MTLELVTARYATFTPAMGIPVQTSIGRPKWPLGYDLTEQAKRLMPWGLLSADFSEAEFTAHYRARLDKVGPDALRRLFHAISARHGGARLVLLCFEDVLTDLRGPGARKPGRPAHTTAREPRSLPRGSGRSLGFCHRRVFATWYEEQTGHHVPELSTLVSATGEQLALCSEAPANSADRRGE
jgi:hypothetical protein